VSQPPHPYYTLTEQCHSHHAKLVAVSKTRTIDETMTLYEMGQRIFAENRAQEIIAKAPEMPEDIEWHLIGHLQTNKVRMIMPYVRCIQSLDSLRLFKTIDQEALKAGKKMRCLLQIKVAQEESKFGWAYDELLAFLQTGEHHTYTHVMLEGIMGMTTLTDDQTIIRKELKTLKKMFDQIKADYFSEEDSFNTLSMGMSGDYAMALEEGSTMIRVGSLLFSK
jgi:pyridoxal phosphate enzyme (YggS family)